MNYLSFFETLKSGDLLPFYLFEGEEEYIKVQAVKTLCGRLLPEGLEAMNLTELQSPPADALIAAAETMPVMADKRVVLVREFAPLKSGRASQEDDADRIIAYLPQASPSACMVFLVKGKADGRKKLYGYLKKARAIVNFSPMGEREAVEWIMRTMKTLGKRMPSTVAERFLFTVGNDAALLKQEIEKLAAYAGDQNEIRDEDIRAITVQSPECTVFQMVDAQVAGNYKEAFVLLQRMLQSGEDRMMVLAMLLRQYRMLFQARCLLEEGVREGELASLLKIPPFAARRTQAQAMRYDKQRLKDVYDYLLDFEFRLKSGKLPQDGSAEAALMQMKLLLGKR